MLPLGTKEHPLRCSRLATLIKCSMQQFLAVQDEDDLGGPSAQTGSVVHAGVAEFHKCQDKLSIRTERGWNAMAEASKQFPEADLNEVRLFFQPYISDPRNIHAIIPLWIDGTPAVEKKIDFTLEPHEIDPTKAKIYVSGTFDHIRMDDGIPRLYDLKTGKKTPWEQIHDYAIQMAAYTYGIKSIVKNQLNLRKEDIRERALFYNKIIPGNIIRNYGYRARTVTPFQESPDGVFLACPYRTMRHCELLLENVRLHVALYRMGYVNFGPGNWCTFCPLGGLPGCLDKFEQLELRQ